MTDIPCPVCLATGYDPLDVDWGVTYVANCPCCQGSKTVTQMTVHTYISQHRTQVVALQNELAEARDVLRTQKSAVAANLAKLKASLKVGG